MIHNKQRIFKHLENKAQQVIDSSLTPFECLKHMNELSGAIDILIKCHIFDEKQDIDKAFDILEQVTTFAQDSLPEVD